ncbi:CU044_5270 family protein [Streptomyces sp.]|uniref:CU044_5270 family protein n=1 Tax=Streptomyces sp. TaxID=1931 RepID=UPI002D2422F9|nr:CU044_5270 family protein [Streptomyces sp.]HZF90696.1 CU044_5270 family protein [Streptomyces sp.]
MDEMTAELTAVRELRADAPAPERAGLVAGRDRLLAEARRGSRARRLRSDWRLAAIGAAAAITAAALVVPQVTEGRGEALPGARPGYTIELGSAEDWLNDAAYTVAAGPAVTARDGQWIYTETVESNGTDDERPGPQTEERWTRYADSAMEDGEAGDDHSPREQYAFLKSLPDDPQQIRARARAFFHATDVSETRTEHEYRALTALLSRAYVYDPEDLAKVYRALATVPGVRAADVQDAAGRDAIALYREGPGPRQETLLDPRTRLYSGYRYLEDGEVMITGARLTTRVVDGEEERR